jgi:phosphatidylglycerol---prolipoprotein diacylglyceryl transferase
MESVTASKSPRRFKLSKFILSWYGIILVYAFVIGLFLILRSGNGNNPVFLSLGSLSFRWYGVIITTGVIIAAFLAQFLAERRRDDPDHVWRLLPIVLITGIAVARIWYVTFTFDHYKDYLFSIGNEAHPGAIEIWRGGIAIQGAVIGGILGTLGYGAWYNRRLKKQDSNAPRFSIWRFADFVAPGLVLAQAMGRWGNFMNNEAYGRETKWFWGVRIPCEYRTSGATPGTDNTLCPLTAAPQYGTPNGGISQDALFHPTFLYESLWDYFTFLILFYCVMKPKTIERRFRIKLRDGDVFLLYWVIYSIGRFFIEGLRVDSLYVIGGPPNGLRSAQLTAVIAILVAGFLLFYRHRKSFPLTQALSVKLAQAGAVLAGPVGTKATVSDEIDLDETVAENNAMVQPNLSDESQGSQDTSHDTGDDGSGNSEGSRENEKKPGRVTHGEKDRPASGSDKGKNDDPSEGQSSETQA